MPANGMTEHSLLFPVSFVAKEIPRMKKMIKAEIYHDGEFYCARCLDFDVFTQGKTLDEVIGNLKEAVHLHFQDDPASLGEFAPNPSLFAMMDLGEIGV
jgi:predicted RNase H-like HicB family nuclease